MKLLALHNHTHDSSIVYFDGEKLHFFKPERHRNIKHYAYERLKFDKNQKPLFGNIITMDNITWEDDIQREWGITVDDIDDIAVTYEPRFRSQPYSGVGDDPVTRDLFHPAHVDYPYFGNIKCDRVNHHYAHFLSCVYLTDEEPNVGIAIDGMGDEGSTWTVYKDDQIIDRGTSLTGSIGFAVERMAAECNVNSYKEMNTDGAGKWMGLQSYGKINEGYLEYLQQFDISQVMELIKIKYWHGYCGSKVVGSLNLLDRSTTIHYRLEQIVLDLFRKHCNKDDVIFYAGGVAQNVIWNTSLKREFPNLVIPPHSTDEGLALGSMEYLRRKHNLPKEKFKLDNFPYCQKDVAPDTKPSDETIKEVAKLLAEGKMVAWYQGNGEVGPRALGNRSILYNPAIPRAKDTVNKVKRRERYRPFGASILSEHRDEYFIDLVDNPYMLYVANSVPGKELDGITHVDGTCRVQTVKKGENKYFRKLLEEFYKLTGIPVLLNTSLNLAGYPIAGHTDDVLDLYDHTEIDVAVIGDVIYNKHSN